MELFLGLIFLCVMTLVLAGGNLFGESAVVKKRLARLSDGSRAVVEEPNDRHGLFRNRENQGWVKLLGPLAKLFGDEEKSASAGRARQRLREAGYRRDSALTIFQGARIVLAIVLPFVTLAAVRTSTLSHEKMILAVCLAAGLGLVMPSYVLDKRRGSRQLAIQNGLPDALDLMVVCVEAGLGVNASLARVAREFRNSSPILAGEFELVTLEVRAGKSSTDALRSLAERSGVTELSSLVAMLVQTERFGTSVADTLRVFADSMRTQRMLRAEEQAGKAPIKMLFPTVVIFLATLIIAIGPGLMQMFAFFGDHQG